jgi:predicted nucleotidyltransferase
MSRARVRRVSEAILRKHIKSLFEYQKYIESIYVYGSAVTKKEANDIDVLIIINDSISLPSSKILELIEKKCGFIEEQGKKKGLIFHFQPLKMLSKWWHLVLDGEPWVIASLKKIYLIYDKKNLVSEVAKLIGQETIYHKEEKAEKLIERSECYNLKNRQLLLNSLTSLANAATEAAQILLLFDNKFILNKKKIVDELEKSYMKVLGSEIIGNYKEIIDLEEKMEKGSLSEFSAENLDYYLDKTKKFIERVEAMLSKK